MKLEAICSRKYKAIRTSGTRNQNTITLIVLHDEEVDTAEIAAAWFANPKSQGSAHLCVDDLMCYRTLLNEEIPWAAPGANTQGFHIEQAGFAKWSTVVWKKHRQTLRRAAYKTAVHCVRFEIPPVFVFAAGLARGESGVTTHAECTRAFGPVGGHSDPGPFWPRRTFMRYVRGYYATLVGGL